MTRTVSTASASAVRNRLSNQHAARLNTDVFRFLGLIASALALLAFSPPAQASAEPLRVGMYQNPPKIFKDDQGRPAGFWPELIDGVFDELGHEAVWVDCEWAGCLELLEAGEIDVMPDVAYSAERAQRFAFADHPVLYSWSTILLAGDISVDVLEDLTRLRVAVVENSIQARNLAAMISNAGVEARLVETATMEDAARALTLGEADAALVNSFFARRQLDRPEIRAASIPFGVSTLHLALSPQMPASLSETLNIAIYQQQIDPASAFSAAQQRWINDVEPTPPPWLWRTLIFGSALIVLSIILNFALRHLVRQRTATLRETVKSLKREMTQRQRAEARLVESQKIESLGRLVGGVAHDFNNLLAVIMGNLEILRSGRLGRDETEMLDDALTASRRGATLTKQLLSFGRRAALQPEIVDLNAVLSSLDKMMRRVMPETIQVEFVRADDLRPAALDVAQLESALLNLAINARDAMPEGGRLTIETANICLTGDDVAVQDENLPPGEYVRVSVSDTGAGMTDAVLSHAIEPFFTTKPQGEGSGMGLAMVHGFAKQSGGALRISSAPGLGATITLYFPVADSAPAEKRETRPERSQAASEHILLVEDEAPVRDTLARQLRLIGYTVTEASNGRAALQALETSAEIHLVLTDIVMPGDLQGPELAEIVRERLPHTQIVFMSGYPQDAVGRETGLGGDDLLLMKPIQYDELVTALRAQARKAAPI